MSLLFPHKEMLDATTKTGAVSGDKVASSAKISNYVTDHAKPEASRAKKRKASGGDGEESRRRKGKQAKSDIESKLGDKTGRNKDSKETAAAQRGPVVLTKDDFKKAASSPKWKHLQPALYSFFK